MSRTAEPTNPTHAAPRPYTGSSVPTEPRARHASGAGPGAGAGSVPRVSGSGGAAAGHGAARRVGTPSPPPRCTQPAAITAVFKRVTTHRRLHGVCGVCFTPDQRTVIVVPAGKARDGTTAGRALELDLATGKTTMRASAQVGKNGGMPAGCQCDRGGNVWLADRREGILKLSAGTRDPVQVSRTTSDGRPMQGCNDCVFDEHGNLYATAPAGPIAPEEYRTSRTEPFGAVYCVRGAAASESVVPLEVETIGTGYLGPSGLCVSADGATLIVAEMYTRSLWRFDITAEATATNRRLFAKVPGEGNTGPSGMAFDSDGFLLVANWGNWAVEVLDADGQHVGRIRCPFRTPGNLCFVPDSHHVLVSEHDYHAVWSFGWRTTGQPLFAEGIAPPRAAADAGRRSVGQLTIK